MHACGSPPAGGVVGGGVVGGGVAGGAAAGGGAAGADADELSLLGSFELLELLELEELFFGGSFVVAALPLLSAFGSVPSSADPLGMAGAAQPASAATLIVERASSERATSWVAAFIGQILWLRSRLRVTPMLQPPDQRLRESDHPPSRSG